MAFIDSNKQQISATPMKTRCKTCHKRIAGVWPDGLCIDCYILEERKRFRE